MDSLYSWTLLIALVTAVAGTSTAIVALFRKAAAGRTWTRAASAILALAALSLLVSLSVHWRWGHGATSDEPMDVPAFAAAHPAFFVAGGLVIVGSACAAVAGRDR